MLAAFWLFWPGPERIAVDQRRLAELPVDEQTAANVNGLVNAAQASIAVSAKGRIVGAAPADDRLEGRVAGTMPAIGRVSGPDGAALPGSDARDPEAAALVEMATVAPDVPPTAPEPRADLAALSPLVILPPPAPLRSSEIIPDGSGADPASPVVTADPASPAGAEPRSTEAVLPMAVAHAAGPAGSTDPRAPSEGMAPALAPIRLQPPELAPGRAPTWLQNAVAPVIDDRPAIAIVIDDLGPNRAGTSALNRLPAPLTLAFLPYAQGLAEQTRAARAAGHELLVHVPMEPRGTEWPGPDALTSKLGPAELVSQLRAHLRSFEGFVGVNNHMGSRLTEDPERMDLLMAELRQRGLLFLDSRTTSKTVAGREARRLHVPYAERDVFLDNEVDLNAVLRQLRRAEGIARSKGYAVAMGHPHDVTIEALRRWLPTLEARGFALVPISAIVARRSCVEAAPLIDDVCARYTAVAGLVQ